MLGVPTVKHRMSTYSVEETIWRMKKSFKGDSYREGSRLFHGAFSYRPVLQHGTILLTVQVFERTGSVNLGWCKKI